MAHGTPLMELHYHGSNSDEHYKSYEVFSFREDIKKEIFDTVTH